MKYFLIVFFVLDILFYIAWIDKESPIISKEGAVFNTIISGIILAFIIKYL
jgi:hypothetical protein